MPGAPAHLAPGRDPAGSPADQHAYENCRICPRHCGVNRLAGQRGYCGQSAVCRIGGACVHFGEEPAFSGTRGSGTIFFSGCTSRCFFCQNHQISSQNQGRDVSGGQLFAIAVDLVEKGVHNLNFVTPDHFLPHVVALCRRLRDTGVRVPFICNCSAYLLAPAVNALCEVMDIFLPDFKFAEPVLARDCMRDAAYPEIALDAVAAMIAAKGFLEPWDETGKKTAEKGVLVRHLLLPDQVGDSIRVLSRLHAAFGPQLPLSVMSQFRPTDACRRKNRFTRPPAPAAYERLLRRVETMGFSRVYIQPDYGDSDFLPDFDSDAIFPGNEKKTLLQAHGA